MKPRGRVWATWSDGEIYPGRLERITRDGRCLIWFKDGWDYVSKDLVSDEDGEKLFSSAEDREAIRRLKEQIECLKDNVRDIETELKSLQSEFHATIIEKTGRYFDQECMELQRQIDEIENRIAKS